MDNGNLNKARILGMPFGTASARLRKLILFELVKQTGLDICVKCRKRIRSANECSIEHIKPWQRHGADLFWDLNNIGFSHRKCNTNAGCLGARSIRHQHKEGLAWCSGHLKWLKQERFYRNKARPTGFSDYCKTCHDKH